MEKSKQYPKPLSETEPEVFIIESLNVEDEIRERYEGRALRDSLRITGQRPAYYYVRTRDEMIQAVELFRHSSYRFLHISVHGSNKSIFTTLDEISNADFSEMCAGKLKNRRVFFSACKVGSGTLNLLLQRSNKGMYSIAAPLDKITFGPACAFWNAFYTKMLIDNPLGMKIEQLKTVLSLLCSFFNIRLNWNYYVPATDSWKAMVIESNSNKL